MQNLTTTARPATCRLGVSWCTTDHDGDTTGDYAHTTAETSEAIETRDRNGLLDVLFVDLEQTDTDPEPRIVLHGTAIDETYALNDAERIARQILTQVTTARARQAVAA